MRIITISIFLLFLACNNSKKELKQEYPKRIGDRLYINDSTFHFMDGSDTLTVLLDVNTQEIAYPQRIGDRFYTTDSTFHFMDGNDTLTKLLHKNTLERVKK